MPILSLRLKNYHILIKDGHAAFGMSLRLFCRWWLMRQDRAAALGSLDVQLLRFIVVWRLWPVWRMIDDGAFNMI